ncbi:hypothetical protein [Polaribacter sp. Z022]|uniref:hypothetical protein n=1 Tax=Polaribacter sp. Z022 TaxID=2927125 RepID=UPI002021908C|nr:hypothetical protein [Polaribacter sp. Z022]MCL7755101.1 hypothetical protein [Polaribacter sp. Z022]
MKETIEIKSSSSDEVYTVTFMIENNLTSINCNCRAGQVKMLCKHRLSLLDGDISSLADESQIPILSKTLELISNEKISDLYTELNQVESELKKLNSLKKKLRKEIGFKFSNGF